MFSPDNKCAHIEKKKDSSIAIRQDLNNTLHAKPNMVIKLYIEYSIIYLIEKMTKSKK